MIVSMKILDSHELQLYYCYCTVKCSQCYNAQGWFTILQRRIVTFIPPKFHKSVDMRNAAIMHISLHINIDRYLYSYSASEAIFYV